MTSKQEILKKLKESIEHGILSEGKIQAKDIVSYCDANIDDLREALEFCQEEDLKLIQGRIEAIRRFKVLATRKNV